MIGRKLFAIVLCATAVLCVAPSGVASEPARQGSPGGPQAVERSPDRPDGAATVSAYVLLEGDSVATSLDCLVGRQARIAGGSGAALEVAQVRDRYWAQLATLESRVRLAQEPALLAAERLGVQVVSRYTTVANGLLVHATADQLNALRGAPGVAAIEPAIVVRPELAYSAPHTGAPRLAAATGYDGTDSVVAIIDTGVDYTHAHLGGPGTSEAWAAASAPGATETITDTWEDVLLFPNDKVVGGWDFVGPRYNPPHLCSREQEEAGECTSIPEPDPDPLDGGGHGTHVAGIVAGNAVGNLADGMAPGAKLVALKLYGRGGDDEAADVLVDAIEWCARVNLGLEDRGVLPERIDAINISLGETQAQGSRLFDEAVAAATATGIVVVASAGNSGDRPFVLGSPAASPKVLSVASALPPAPAIEVAVAWEGQERTYVALESQIAQPLDEAGSIEAELAWYGRGCNDDDVYQDVSEKVALIARGECTFVEKIMNAQGAGAIAVLMFTDDRPKSPMGGRGEEIEIPAVMIDREPGLDLAKTLEHGTRADTIIDPERRTLDTESADGISGFSSRGPSKNGALKPDITAPGSNIFSTRRGGAKSGVTMGGTSMSGPHVAGAAAVVHERNRAEGLSLDGTGLGALLMNYSRPIVFRGGGVDKETVPVVRQGAGAVDLWQAGHGAVLVRTGDIASVNLGAMALTRSAIATRRLEVTNLADRELHLAVEARFAYTEDVGAGIEAMLPTEVVDLPQEGTIELPIVFHLAPELMRPWRLCPTAGASASAVETSEIDGYIVLQPVRADGTPEEALPPASVPFYALPRRASALASRGLPGLDEEGADTLTIANRSAYPGAVELFLAPPRSDTLEDEEDPDEPDVAYELDLRRVGVRVEPPTEEVTTTMVTFGLARHERAAIPQVTRFEIYLDVDRDGATDHRIREVARGDRMETRFSEWDEDSGGVVGQEAVTDTLHSTDLHTHLTSLSVPAARIGMTDTHALAFDFYVLCRGLNEDWLHGERIDEAPDGARGAEGPRYTYDPSSLTRVPAQWQAEVVGWSKVDLNLNRSAGDYDPTLLAFYPANRFESAERQIQILRPGVMRPQPGAIFLPLAEQP